MPRTTTSNGIVYAESDGRPMGETDLHRDWMIRLLDLFRYYYRSQRVYVASDLLLYYEEGNPSEFVVPDLFVVLDCDPGQRRTFKIWEEDRVPNLVVEVTSRSSRSADRRTKPDIYQSLGVEEYVLFDPTGDYLSPPLQGFWLDGAKYRRITAGVNDEIACKSIGVTFQLADNQLVVLDSQTREVLRTVAEAHEAARVAAERRAARLELELAELRQQLNRDNPQD